jgi:hypothetical protein
LLLDESSVAGHLHYGLIAREPMSRNRLCTMRKQYSGTLQKEEAVPLLADRDQRTLARMVRDYVDGVACRCANHGCLDCHG